MSTLKKLASQTAVYGVSQILGRFVNYLLVPLYTNLFTPGEYGVVTLLYSNVTFLNVLLTYGMETAFFRFASKSEDPYKTYSTGLTSILTTSLLFTAVAFLFSHELADLLRIPQHPEYVQWFILIIALDAIAAIPFALLRQQNKPIRFAILRNINIFTNILLNLYFLMLCPYAKSKGISLPFYSPEIGIGYIFISNLVASILTIPLLSQELLKIKNAAFDSKLWREMIVYALPLMIVGFAGMINETLDRNLITWLSPDPQTGLAMNGIYGANYKLAILMSLFIQAFRYAAEPFFFSHAKTDDKREIYAQVMNYFVLVCLFLFLSVTLFIDLFQYFIGASFREGLKIVPVLLIANMFLGIYYNLSIWYKLSNQTGKGALISIIGAAITIVLNIWWIPVYGYIGSAWATFCCYGSMMFICYWMGMKYYPIPYRVLRLGGYMLFALLLYSLGTLISNELPSFIPWLLRCILLLVFCAGAWIAERKEMAFFRK